MLFELLLGYLALNFVITLYLGFLQTPPDEPARESFAIAGVIALCLQAAVTLFLLGWTVGFYLGALWLAFTVVCHHGVIHRNSRFEHEPCACAFFQCKDVSNHETWVVAALVAAVVSGLRV